MFIYKKSKIDIIMTMRNNPHIPKIKNLFGPYRSALDPKKLIENAVAKSAIISSEPRKRGLKLNGSAFKKGLRLDH
jgi:hypothetical protein